MSAPTTPAAPVLVTGIGLATPLGMTVQEYWERTLRGDVGVGPITRFDPSPYPVAVAGEVADFDPGEHVPARLLPQTDRTTRLALAASATAMADACLDPTDLPPFGMGVVTASSAGGYEFGQRELENLWARGPQHVSAYQSFAWFYAVNTGQISIRHGLRGPGGVVVADQAGGLDALAQARRHLRRGTRAMLAGGVDSVLCPWGLAAQIQTGTLSPRSSPTRAYLPFDGDASGSVPGEGGAMLVLELSATARQRSAPHRYGVIAGCASTLDPRPGAGRAPTLRRAAELALADAGCRPADVDVVFADGAGVPEADRAEALAITELFGPRRVPVTAPKAGLGRLAAGGGPLDVLCALLALRDQVVPPTPNVTDVPGEYAIDLVVAAPRPAHLRTALVLARGHGGFNSAVVVRAAGSGDENHHHEREKDST